jgi:hypothetical protein
MLVVYCIPLSASTIKMKSFSFVHGIKCENSSAQHLLCCTVLAPVFAHPVILRIRILHVKYKIIGKVKMETTAM